MPKTYVMGEGGEIHQSDEQLQPVRVKGNVVPVQVDPRKLTPPDYQKPLIRRLLRL